MRRHLTYANVVSTLCLILLLGGGTALASVIVSKNSQVGRGTISGHHPPKGDHPNIIGGSVSGSDLAGGIKTSLRLHCPSGLRDAGDICFEDPVRESASLPAALQTCAVAERRLPSFAELALIYDHLGAPQDAEWVATQYEFSNGGGTSTSSGVSLAESASRQLSFVSSTATSSRIPYRCVTTATN